MSNWYTEVCSHISDRIIHDYNENELYTQKSSLFFPKSQSNIVIRWKLFNFNKDIIFEFQSLSSKETTYSFPSIEVHLPEEILSNVQIFEDYDTGNIHVMFLTITGSFNRVIFDGTTYLYQNDLTSKEHWKVYQIENLKDAPVLFHCIDIDTFVVATEDGDLIVIDCPRPSNNEIYDNSYYEHEISQKNLITKNIKSLFKPFSLNKESESSSPQQIVDISSIFYKLKMTLFTVCRDKYLRIFSLYDYSCIKSISLGEIINKNITDKSLLNEEPARYISIFDVKPEISGQTFKIAVYLPECEDYASSFILFKGKLNINGDFQYLKQIGVKECDFSDVENCNMVDFQVVKNEKSDWVLWVIWKKENNETVMQHITVLHKNSEEEDEIEYNCWNKVLTKTTDEFDYGINNGLSSIQEKYIDYIFFPNRFSLTILTNTLNKYIKITQNLSNTPLNQCILKNINIESLKKIIIETIRSNVIIGKQYSHTDFYNAYQNCIQKEYERFLKICLEEYNIQNQPQSLAYNPISSTIFIVKSTNVSTLRPISTIEVIHNSFLKNIKMSNLLLLPSESFQDKHSELANYEFRNDLQKYFITLDFIIHAFTVDRWQEIRTELEYELSQHLSLGVTSFAHDFYEYNLKPELEEYNSNMVKLLKRIQQPTKLIESILSLFEALNINFKKENYNDDNCFIDVLLDINNMPPTLNQYIVGIVSSGIQQVIDSYYETCFYLLVVLICIYNTMPNHYLPNKIGLLKRCQTCFYILSIFKYFISCPTNNYNIQNDEKEMESQENNSQPRSTHKQLRFEHKPYRKPNLNKRYTDSKSALPLTQEPQAFMHYLINHYCDVDIDFSTQPGPSVINYTVFECIKQFITCDSSRLLFEEESSVSSKKLRMLQTYVDHFPLSLIYLINDLEIHNVFINILPRLITYLPTLPSTLYLRGKILLHMEENDKAHDLFLKASTGFTSETIIDESLSNILKLSRLEISNLETYYKHIINMFEIRKLHQQVINFTNYAIGLYSDKQNLTEKDKSEVDYFKKLKFIHDLELHNFDEAYSSLVSFSDPEMRIYLLRQFVTSMIKAEEILKLCSYSYTGMEEEFENIIYFKIRNSNIQSLLYSKAYDNSNPFEEQKTPEPDYNKILFTYYTFKGNFRDAALVMYYYFKQLNSILLNIQSDEKLKFIILREQSQSLLAVINSLSLVNEKSRYLMIKCETSLDELNTNTKKRRRVHSCNDEVMGSNQAIDIIQLSEIKKEYLLSLAKLEYINCNIEDAETAVSKYLEEKKYDKAVNLASHWSIDSSLLFQSLASECIVDMEKYGNVFNAEALNDQTKAWKQLEDYLKVFENSEHFSSYKKIVMETLFSLDHEIVLPKWLMQQYKKKHTEDAVRIYLKYNRIEDATKLLIHQCQKYIESCAPHKTRIWISFALLDQVKLALKEKIKDLRFEKLKFEKYELGYIKYDSESNSDSETDTESENESNSKKSTPIASDVNSDSEEEDSEFQPNDHSGTESGSENDDNDDGEEEEEEEEENSESSIDNNDEDENDHDSESEFSEEDTKIYNNPSKSDDEDNIMLSDMPSGSVVIIPKSKEEKREYKTVYNFFIGEVKHLESLYSSLKQKIDVVLKL
ncbi:hypothetical protein BCR36DRAFT_325982 [Piromyces finnis]|uniref:Uncharacterized protein n=1 Tax=Piromyces finnis TaxID=1754191 RepID=A0A1Y1VAV0_9FUNG|nr:hypothetical protein BCR36DRAFT_325982 [Piromyces finnis]|eukprot:ORX51011.1 hypothetical protein BCR36DRAFT_325982 [Piromyces finnis]